MKAIIIYSIEQKQKQKTSKNSFRLFLGHMKSKSQQKHNQRTAFFRQKIIGQQESLHLNSQTNLSFQKARLAVNQKLLYIKACIQKSSQVKDIFQYYPYNNIEVFKFPFETLLQDLNTEPSQNPQTSYQSSKKKIIKDQNGLHFVQNVDLLTQEEVDINKGLKINKSRQLFNGLSVSIFGNGKVFEGNYHDGSFCGSCLSVDEDGDLYLGHFKDDVKKGFGVYYSFATKEVYKGSWQNDLPHGQGTYNNHESEYEGSFTNGLKNGFGIEKFNSGDYYAGQYVNGTPEGYGQYYWKDGSSYKGDFSHGARHGYGIWENQDQTYFGSYKIDNKEGFGVYTWKNKKVYKGQFKNDYRDGYGEMFSLNRLTKKLKGTYKGGWEKGQRNSSLQVNPQSIAQLYSFLQKQNDIIAQMPMKKQRIGHKNCLPGGGCHSHSH